MLNKSSVNFAKSHLADHALINSKILYKISNSTTNYKSSNNLYSKNTKGVKVQKEKMTKYLGLSSILTKEEITSLKLIGQFDNKFLICIRPKDSSIIIFDQHAIHERILFEYYTTLLLNELYQNCISKEKNEILVNNFECIFDKFDLKTPFRFSAEEFNVDLTQFSKMFEVNKIQNLFYFSFTYNQNGIITLYSVPVIFDKVHKIYKLIEIFAGFVNNVEYYLNIFKGKNIKIIDLFDALIRSKACRNAIKFNDSLDNEIMRKMLLELGECKDPFLCAHGRHNFFLVKK